MIVRTEDLVRRSALSSELVDIDPLETAEWLDSVEAVLRIQGPERAAFILEALQNKIRAAGVSTGGTIQSPYLNTIPLDQEVPYPGDRAMERKIKSIIRWNAMAMVAKANKTTNVGGHIATYQSAATLYEVGFNHFFRGRTEDSHGDIIYFQGHASPGPYARAFVEGRLPEQKLINFRQELQPGGGLSSYPHPWLMPDFWQYPTVSMGIGPIMAIYQARYARYLENRGLAETRGTHIWAYLGDGECDEPETLGCLSIAAREKLDNLIFVINCNLQRLDGPVRGSGKIIQELEGIFKGAGWNVVKCMWGSDWDELLARDASGALSRRMLEVPDGEYQEYAYAAKKGNYGIIREKFFNTAELKALVAHLSDEQLANLKRGGHDPAKVYNAYRAAMNHRGGPTVILAHTIKGYGTASEANNTAHQEKKLEISLTDEEKAALEADGYKKAQELKGLKSFRDRFQIPLTDADLAEYKFYRPSETSPEMLYLRERRKALGGYQPSRNNEFVPCQPPRPEVFQRSHQGTVAKGQSTTLAWVILMGQLMKDPNVGKLIVPIVPDEGQTFGLPPLYNQFGLYNSLGQKYIPVDSGSASSYREATNGQIFQEGINEAGSMATFIAAGTAYSTFSINTIPFYVYYSMFGFQRVGDLIWAAADSRCRGFLMGATAGRTTLNGEGLQHEDGHSHLAALTVPTCRAYDPAWGYELAVIVEEGINRMYVKGEDLFYYLTIYNEAYDMPAMPEGVKDGILKGLYAFKTVKPEGAKQTVQLLGSGVILREVLRAQEILATKYKVASTVYSATSYQELRRDCIEVERFNRLHPDQPKKKSHVETVLGSTPGPVVASSDYMRTLQEQISPYLGGRLLALGTDGFGRSETRQNLRRFFEVDAEHVTIAALYALAERGELDRKVVAQAIKDLGIDPNKPHPWTV
ncbi:pyruvate dehydrogenase (acetyl-transferring), homodimeric type [Zavarzinella formosa]|uniref:pyruvate dehydrogenase (acetyl-transferring), homodimeric type n=1 Tax=Zavarzinella formosa TaxID=360055 RepID=UPI0002F78FD3|nr:pyruvate dehydrogenase (acetyl-transferring), homodimeric type [Zavarzinella formosa]